MSLGNADQMLIDRIKQLIIEDPGSIDQIAFTQQHLQYEAERFQLGDYSDQANLHGSQLPGLKGL